MVFLVQNKVEDVLTWRNPIETISAMTIFSLVTLNPGLLISLPLFIVVFALLVPGYEARHPPPPSTLSSAPTEVTSAISPPLQPAKPAPELSRDFFMNMRDIQNSMDDFNNLYDLVRTWVVHVTTFRDEPLSSTVLAFATIAALTIVVSIQLLPMRWIILLIGNATILACNPVLFKYLMQTYLSPEEIERIKSKIDEFVKEDYIPPPPPQYVTFPVEIFESKRLLPPVPPAHLPDWSAPKYSRFPPRSTDTTDKLPVVSPPAGYVFAPDDWKVDETKKWVADRSSEDDTGFWIADGEEFDREGDRWVSFDAGGWKVRRLTRGVVRAVEKE